MPAIHAFDQLADDYDVSFTGSILGERMRAAVWRRLDDVFVPGQRILEIGCGTGEDALHLARRGLEVVAFDRSERMVETARRKLAAHDLTQRARVDRLAIEEWAARPGGVGSSFDGALSNFGALNCVGDLAAVARALASSLRPGGRAVVVIMGPSVPWEWLWFLAHGQPRTAFRRWRPGGSIWRGLRIRYPGIGQVRRSFSAWFRPRRPIAVGALLPPSYVEAWEVRRPRLIARLDRIERRVESWPGVAWLADHYLLELERRSEPPPPRDGLDGLDDLSPP